MLKKLVRKSSISLLAIFIVVVSTMNGSTKVDAANEPPVYLDGIVLDSSEGFIDNKVVRISNGNSTNKIRYSISSGGATSGYFENVTVEIELPVLQRDADGNPITGVQAIATNYGGGWEVVGGTNIGDRLTHREKLVMTIPSLGQTQPAFDLILEPYGQVEEGTSFDVRGIVKYDTFTDRNNTFGPWQTPGNYDERSLVKAVSSSLEWEHEIKAIPEDEETTTNIPIWDRYQYVGYQYRIENTVKDSPASIVEGYDVTFVVDTFPQSGIIPYDIKRFFYGENGQPEKNPNPEASSDREFIGIEGEGGLLIYDISHLIDDENWDGYTGLENPLPYTYGGDGQVTIKQSIGDKQIQLTPEGEPGDTKRVYMIQLPLSRQGFPQKEVQFKVKAITNVIFAKGANWSQTTESVRNVEHPTYDFEYIHEPQQPDVVYGYDTYFELKDLVNKSNVGVYKPKIEYKTNKDYKLTKVTFELPLEINGKKPKFSDYLDETFLDAVILGDENILVENLNQYEFEEDLQAGVMRLTVDLDVLEENEEWTKPGTINDRGFVITFSNKVKKYQKLPIRVKVHGQPYELGTLEQSANLIYIEKIASNEDWSIKTEYSEIEHTLQHDAQINVVMPNEAIPHVAININDANLKYDYDNKERIYIGKGTYEEPVSFNYRFGIGRETIDPDAIDKIFEANSTRFETIINGDEVAVHNTKATLDKAFFTHAKNVRIKYTIFGDEENIEYDLPYVFEGDDVTLTLKGDVRSIIIETDHYRAQQTERDHFLTVDGTLNKGVKKTHDINAIFEAYQGKPYDRTNVREAKGRVSIVLPNELDPQTEIIGIYGSTRTSGTTQVPYEARFGMEYRLNTKGVTSPFSSYTINLNKPTKTGEIEYHGFTIHQEFLSHVSLVSVTIIDKDNNQQTLPIKDLKTDFIVDFKDITLKDIDKIVVETSDLKLDKMTPVVTVDYQANHVLGSSQSTTAVFEGSQLKPYTELKHHSTTNNVVVPETQTRVKVKGVNQVSKNFGAGNSYDMQIFKCWACSTTYQTNDYTLNQGYKSLGGFTASVTRPTSKFENNNQETIVTMELPYQHFDSYYIKIRNEMKDNITDVKIYRINLETNQEELWKIIPGNEWVNNTQEQKYWRINTALNGNDGSDLFATFDNFETDNPYYKMPFSDVVIPDAPVSRVEVTLNYERLGADAAPQMSGHHEDIIEVMGRFYATSPNKSLDTNELAKDTIGTMVPLNRSASHSIKSLVGYSYAQSKTGANTLGSGYQKKTVMMGSTNEYLGSIWNYETVTRSYSYPSSGPDVYIPAKTEYNEWIYSRDSGAFHDKLIYEFTYPKNPAQDDTFNFDAKYFVLENSSTLKYLTGIKITTDDNKTITYDFPSVQNGDVRFDYQVGKTFEINETELGHYVITLREGQYPSKVEATFEEINGFGDQTAEIKGKGQDTLSNLNEINLRFGGVVNGNNALRGITKIYREPNDTKIKQEVHQSYAEFVGYTPKLGATTDIKFDQRDLYDYGKDGITPNTTNITLDLYNSSEADIKDVVLNFKSDPHFRTQKLSITEEIFKGKDYGLESVSVVVKGKETSINPDYFTYNQVAKRYELDLEELFNKGILQIEHVENNLGDPTTLNVKHISNLSMNFKPQHEDARLWGSFARETSEEENLPIRLTEGGTAFIEGIWIDETDEGSNWKSKPGFITDAKKGSNNVIYHNSTFTVSATVNTYQPFYTNAGSGNSGINPSLTRNVNNGAPRIMTRVAQMQLLGTHLDNNHLEILKGSDFFYDKDTNKQISSTNINVGDTAKVLYELRNNGKEAISDNAAGTLPIFRPSFYVEVPEGMMVSDIYVVGNSMLQEENFQATVDKSPNSRKEIDVESITIKDAKGNLIIDSIANKRVHVELDTVLDFGESAYIYVEYTAINDFKDQKVQGKTVQWNAYARPYYTHLYMSYDSNGVSTHGITGTTSNNNFDGDKINEHYGRVYNGNYKYSDPNKLRIESKFDVENVSGKEMTLTLKNIINETLHSNTQMELFVKLDKENLKGFELTEFPAPSYPEGMEGKPSVYFKHDNDWISVEAFDASIHEMKDINELKVDYGIVKDIDEHSGKAWEAPSFEIKGKGHWQTKNSLNTKSYDIISEASVKYTNFNDAEFGSQYQFTTNAKVTTWKAIPQIEFNIQSFDTKDEATQPYKGSAVGKVNYLAGDDIWYKLTTKNHTTYQGTSTNTPYGKAPFINPVIVDKIPEYLNIPFNTDEYINQENQLDIEKAITDGLIQIHWFDEQGNRVEQEILPKVEVETVQGLDIAGAQTFNNERHNDGWGLLSKSQPIDTKGNPADTIDYLVVTYQFNEHVLDRGARFEIIYHTKARSQDLPYATYADGRSVWAPLNGWYGTNNPVAKSQKDIAMDMASLLHDAGVTGNKGHEMTSEEFLSNSYSWIPGSTGSRNTADSSNGTFSTFYDGTANKETSHTAYLKETSTMDLYQSFTSSTLDDNYNYANKGRILDTQEERILWGQDGLQLNRAWLYGVSEMRPSTLKQTHGADAANFFETDGSLHHSDIANYSFHPSKFEKYSYAVELHEIFTMRLHAVNMGDRPIESGIEYLSILPVGITPYDEEGKILGISAYTAGTQNENVTYEVIQTPESDKGYRAPKQLQEAGTYKKDTRDEIPYVVRIKVTGELKGAFNNPTGTTNDKYQYVDMKVRVYNELKPQSDGYTYWHDELTVTTLEPEEYLEIYSHEYGAYNGLNSNTSNLDRYDNDAMRDGLEVNFTSYARLYYPSYIAYEPYGMYIRGLNAQGTALTYDGKPAIVTGDQILMRKPTLRVWSQPEKQDSNRNPEYPNGGNTKGIDDFNVNLYEKFTLHTYVENQQLEVTDPYLRTNTGYNRPGYSDNRNDDLWKKAPQTIGGARGSYFEPVITIELPYGVNPILENGNPARRYTESTEFQELAFTAGIYDTTYNSKSLNKELDKTMFNTSVTLETKEGKEIFVLRFEPKNPKTLDVRYGQSIVISPEVMAVDNPMNGQRYEGFKTFAGTQREVFNPVVSKQYGTGSNPSITAKDLGNVSPNNVKSRNGKSITENDRMRLDSTTLYSSNRGYLAIPSDLIGQTEMFVETNNERNIVSSITNQTEKYGAVGSSTMVLKMPTIQNKTKVLNWSDSKESDLIAVDPAGKHWYLTEVSNQPLKNSNPFIQIQSEGDIHHSRFLITYFVTNFAEKTDNYRIKLSDDTILTPELAKAKGWDVEIVETTAVDKKKDRVQFIITTPPDFQIETESQKTGNRGYLASGASFKFMWEAQMVAGYEDITLDGNDKWDDKDDLRVESFISVIADDTTLQNKNANKEDFIVQDFNTMGYQDETSDTEYKIDINGLNFKEDKYATQKAYIEIIKPKAEVRKNTLRPRLMYSNGYSGDASFRTLESIEYMMTHAKITGSGLKEFVIEDILPTYKKDKVQHESSIRLTHDEIETTLEYVSTGRWSLPEETLDRIEANGDSIDELFKVFVYVSTEDAQDGYETNDDWILLNPTGTSVSMNEKITLDKELATQVRKVRFIIRALQPDSYLLPTGTRLDIDANPETPDVKEDVTETDPKNQSVEAYPTSVSENAIHVALKVYSKAEDTLFVYNTAQAWGNYVGNNISKLDQSEVRAYVTPSSPVINLSYSAKNYVRQSGTEANRPYIWDNAQMVNPDQSPILKFKAEVINADKSMWNSDVNDPNNENNAYSEDTLINPFVSFKLPNVMETIDRLEFVDNVTADHFLHDDYQGKSFRLPTHVDDEVVGYWTWRLVKQDGSISTIAIDKEHEPYVGQWRGNSQNIISIWFKGNVEPGDRIIVEFIGSITSFAAPGSNDLKSKVEVTNNTGILRPLNSRMNQGNNLGYESDLNDLDSDNKTNDHLVTAERTLFDYEKVNNFLKDKKVFSDLDKAPTAYPNATRVREGGIYTFESTIQNMQASDTYRYPIIYDVLPHVDDTEIMLKGVNKEIVPRLSKFKGLLDIDSIEYAIESATSESESNTQIYQRNKDYQVYVGPFKKVGKEIQKLDALPSHEMVSEQKFYMDLKDVPNTRKDYFVTLDEFKQSAKGREDEIMAVLVLFNNTNYEMPARSKLKLTYNLKALYNAPVWLEDKNPTADFNDFAGWNTLVTTHVVGTPSESNRAGVYVTESKDRTYLGNYVWHDANYNGIQDEGTLYKDENGRWLIKPDKDINFDGKIDDPGLNGVKVSLRTPSSYPVDIDGNPIHDVDGNWYLVDEKTGESLLDEAHLMPIPAASLPLEKITETDINGYQGYYVFSNIVERDYVVVYEFPEDYDQYGLTTNRVFEDTKVTMYPAGAANPEFKGGNQPDENRLVVVSDVVELTHDLADEKLMSFDIGIGHTLELGGNIFMENERGDEQFNGIKDKDELGIAGYKVFLKDIDGKILKDINGQEIRTISDAQGNYKFIVTPFERHAYLSVTGNPKGTVITPIRINTDPFVASNDNDGYYVKTTKETRSDNLDFDLEGLYKSKFAPRLSVYFGFYERYNTATIGDRVWNDANQNGIQDIGEVGVEGQVLYLHQYALIDGQYELVKEDFMTTTSNKSGLYYFKKVPTMVTYQEVRYPAYYKISIKAPVKGYNITLPYIGSIETDNNFLLNGKMAADDFIEIIGRDDDGEYDEYEPINVNNVDLGLHKHELGVIEGSLFEDTNKDGINNDDANLDTYPNFIINLEVKNKAGNWVKATRNNQGEMNEPDSTNKGDLITITGKDYRFDNLMIVNPNAPYDLYEYRVVVSQIPLWFDITDYQAGSNKKIDNDFKEIKTDNFRTIATDILKLKEKSSDSHLIPVDTKSAVTIENQDFGLIPLVQKRDITGTLWVDGTVYDNDTKTYVLEHSSRDGLLKENEPVRLPDTIISLYRKDVDKKAIRPVVDEEGKPIQTRTDENGYYEFKDLDLADYHKADPNSPTFDKNWKYYNQAIEYVVVFDRMARHEPTYYGVSGLDDDSDFVQFNQISKITNFEDLDASYRVYDANNKEQKVGQHLVVSHVALLAGRNGAKVDYHYSQNAQLDAGVFEHDSIKEISGTLFEDLNKDGYQDDNEPGIENLKVRLFVYDFDSGKWTPKVDENQVPMEIYTNEFGQYAFEVEVADMNKDSKHYQKVYRYKVVSEPRFEDQEKVYRYTLEGNPSARFEYRLESTDGITIENLYTDLVAKEITLAKEVNGLVDLNSIYNPELIAYNQSIDAGFAIYDTAIKIGGRVWHDNTPLDFHQNHIQDPYEKGIIEHEVTLWKKVDGKWIITEDLNGNSHVKTDEEGYYEFKVSPSNYQVNDQSVSQYRVTTSRTAWQKFARDRVGDDPTLDSDILNAVDVPEVEFNGILQGVTYIFDIGDEINGKIDPSSVRDDRHMDVGIGTYVQTVMVGGHVWEDDNFDGLRNQNEDAIVGQVIELWRQIDSAWERVAVTTSDQKGVYAFNVAPTNYDPEHEDYLKPYRYKVTTQREGYQLFAPYRSQTQPLIDSNIQDGLDLNGNEDYRHRGVSDYFEIYSENEGHIDITSVTNDMYMGIGLKTHSKTVLIGGQAWLDLNADGVVSKDEIGLEDVEITLWKHNRHQDKWEKVSQTKTNDEGRYLFEVAPTNFDYTSEDYLAAYDYRVTANRQGYQKWTQPNQGSDPTIDSNITDANKEALAGIEGTHTGVSERFEIYNAEDITSIKDDLDMGIGYQEYAKTITLGGKVWLDDNEDGVMDHFEHRLENKKVILEKYVGDQWHSIDSTLTDVKGEYRFEAVEPTDFDADSENYLIPYRYRIRYEKETNQRFSPYTKHIENESEFDSNVQAIDEHYAISDEFITHTLLENASQLDITSIRDDLHVGVGYAEYEMSVKIGGIVWDDINYDGILDAEESGYEGKVVHLWRYIEGEWQEIKDLNGIGTVTVDSTGSYEFEVAPTNYDRNADDYLEAYQYRISVTREGYEVFSPYRVGDDLTRDSNIQTDEHSNDIYLGVSDVFEITNLIGGKVDIGSVHDDLNMGVGIMDYGNTVKIGGILWDDENYDGIRDHHEKRLMGKTVVLWRFEPEDLSNPLSQGRWVQVEDILGRSEVTTDENGYYEFEVAPTNYHKEDEDYLVPYFYTVTTERSGEQGWTHYRQGEDLSLDSNFKDIEALNEFNTNGFLIHKNQGISDIFNISDYDENYQIDIRSIHNDLIMDGGLITHNNQVQIGDRVWHDANKNGLQDSDEKGIKGVKVRLQEFDSVTKTWVDTSDVEGRSEILTDQSGSYIFTVEAGNIDIKSESYLSGNQYRVMIEIPKGMEATIHAEQETLNSDHVEIVGNKLYSRTAVIYELTEEGVMEHGTVFDDLDIDFGLIMSEVDREIVKTGDGYSVLIPIVFTSTVTLVFILIVVKRKKENLE